MDYRRSSPTHDHTPTPTPATDTNYCSDNVETDGENLFCPQFGCELTLAAVSISSLEGDESVTPPPTPVPTRVSSSDDSDERTFIIVIVIVCVGGVLCLWIFFVVVKKWPYSNVCKHSEGTPSLKKPVMFQL